MATTSADLFAPVFESRAKIVAFGEQHGVGDLWRDQIHFVRRWLEKGLKTLVLLEHGIDEQRCIDLWLATGAPPAAYLQEFAAPRTVAFLNGTYRLFDALAQERSAGAPVDVLCFDMVFRENPEGVTQQDAARFTEILRHYDDEDAFDAAREEFMIDVLARVYDRLRAADRVLLIAGRMHASKSDHYIARNNPPVRHIRTVTNWLSEHEAVIALFYYPVGGACCSHDDDGRLHVRDLKPPQNILATLEVPPHKALVPTSALPDHPEKPLWITGFDFILIDPTCRPDRPRSAWDDR